MHKSIIAFRSGSCRNDPNKNKTHTYAETEDGLWPMCGYGWNRSDGERFSILRSPKGTQGDCIICRKNLINDRPPLKDGWSHKTKWL